VKCGIPNNSLVSFFFSQTWNSNNIFLEKYCLQKLHLEIKTEFCLSFFISVSMALTLGDTYAAFKKSILLLSAQLEKKSY
jgi:hypothetical protein